MFFLKGPLVPGIFIAFFMAGTISQIAKAQSSEEFDAVSGAKIPQSMGALGDSMSAAALADISRRWANLPWNVFGILATILEYKISGDIHAVERRQYSWTTGHDQLWEVKSHARRLASTLPEGKKISFYNASLSGDESKHVLEHQLSELNVWSRQKLGVNYPEYVTLLIGANDGCAASAAEMVDPQTYHQNMVKIIDEVMLSSPDTRLMVSNLPNIERLRNVARNAGTLGGKCESMWETMELCPTLTTINDPAERIVIDERLKDYGRIIEDVVASRQEMFGDRIRLSRETGLVEFDKNDLAVDCFHPNLNGQNKLAEATWKGNWWENTWAARGKKQYDKLKSKALRQYWDQYNRKK